MQTHPYFTILRGTKGVPSKKRGGSAEPGCVNHQHDQHPPTPINRGDNNIDLDQTANNWAERIKKIFYDEELLAEIGQEAIKTIKTKHGPEKHYKKLEKIYEAVSRDKQSKLVS